MIDPIAAIEDRIDTLDARVSERVSWIEMFDPEESPVSSVASWANEAECLRFALNELRALRASMDRRSNA